MYDLSEKSYSLATRLKYSALSLQDFQALLPIQKFGLAYATYLLGISNPNTRKQYKSIIDHFISFLVNIYQQRGTPLKPEQISDTILNAQGLHIAMWRKDLRATGGVAGALPKTGWRDLNRYSSNTNSSIESKTSALSSFFRFLAKPCMDGTQPLLKTNPVDALQTRNKIEKYGSSKKTDITAFKAMLATCNTRTLLGLRNYVLLFSYFMTGRRNSEWLRLRWEDINWNTTPPTYKFTFKGRKKATDELPPVLLAVLDLYFKARWGEGYRDTMLPTTYLFGSLNRTDKPITERQMLRIIKTAAKKASLDPTKIVVHSLRHLHSEECLAAGASVEDIRARLHHQHLGTTQIYTNSLNNEGNSLAEALDQLLREAE